MPFRYRRIDAFKADLEPAGSFAIHPAMSQALSMDQLQGPLLAALSSSPVVLTAPTGTGKSTQVPRWLDGRVLMIQPRRVAARAVAARIAQLNGAALGEEIGYRVRDDDCSGPATRLLVVTPGIVLSRPALLREFDTVILDEFHERRLDTDLIVGLLLTGPERARPAFLAMSATLDAARLAQFLGGQHLHVEARKYPVEISYLQDGDALPHPRDLEDRVLAGLARIGDIDGDILVFLPGKGEIARVQRALGSQPRPIVLLHGGLTLQQQSQALGSGSGRRILLSTNVAETSLTISGVRAVLDCGLVRRTTYHEGRSFLELRPIALDSADQRAGRAGRTAPGQALRLWGARAALMKETPPEIYRESLVPLVMTAAAEGIRPEDLKLLDVPKDYALKDARDRLFELGVLYRHEGVDRLTERGKRLSGLPLDPWLSRLLVEAEARNCLNLALPLVAALEQSQVALLIELAPVEALEVPGCDALALLWVMKERPRVGGTAGAVLKEALATQARLARAMGVSSSPPPEVSLQVRLKLLATLVAADRGMAHVARRRKNRLSFSNGGTEKELGKTTRLNEVESKRAPTEAGVSAVVVLSSRAVSDRRDRRVVITAVAPVDPRLFSEWGLGMEQVTEAKLEKKGPRAGQLVVSCERSYCGTVIAREEKVPRGALARQAMVRLFCSRRLFPAALSEAKSRLSRRGLAAQLGQKKEGFFQGCEPPPQLEPWLLQRLEELGVESGEDLALLSADDFLPEDVSTALLPQLKERFPQNVDLGDAFYEVEYDLPRRQVLLNLVRGTKTKPPQAQYLPRFEGFKVFVEAGGCFHPVRR